MKRRWIIRGFFIGLLTLCVGGLALFMLRGVRNNRSVTEKVPTSVPDDRLELRTMIEQVLKFADAGDYASAMERLDRPEVTKIMRDWGVFERHIEVYRREEAFWQCLRK